MLHLGILLYWRNFGSLLVNPMHCFSPYVCHYCYSPVAFLFLLNSASILILSVKSPAFSFPYLLMCCIFFHLHSSIYLFPSHLLFSYQITCLQFRTFPYFPLSWFFSLSSVFISYTHLAPLSVSLLPHQPGLSLCLQPCIHTSHCSPSCDGCTLLKPYLILLKLGVEMEQEATKGCLQGTN